MTHRESSIDPASAETRAELHTQAQTVRSLANLIDVAAASIRDNSSQLPIHVDVYRLMKEALWLTTIAGDLLDPDRDEVHR